MLQQSPQYRASRRDRDRTRRQLAGNVDAFVIGAGIPGSPLCSGNTSWFRGFAINRFAGAAISMGEEACPAGLTSRPQA